MTKKRNCQHKCIARNFSNKERCKNRVILQDSNHLVLMFQGHWAELCPTHFRKVFNYVISSGPVSTNEIICETEGFDV